MVNTFRRNNYKEQKWMIICIILILTALIYKFIESSGGFSWNINTQIWAHFGAFISAILLSITIFYQIIIYKRQQIENHFFELIKYHRANLNEMEVKNPFQNIGTQSFGRNAIRIFFNQYKVAYSIIQDLIDAKRIEIKFASEKEQIDTLNSHQERFMHHDIAFQIAYFGLTITGKLALEDALQRDYITSNLIYEFVSFPALFDIDAASRDQYLEYLIKKLDNSLALPFFSSNNKHIFYAKKTKLFTDSQIMLNHYFRNIHYAINYIDKQNSLIINNAMKQEYINTYRAQISIEEQALLFLYSISSISNVDGKNEIKDLISKYHLIKDIPKNYIPDIDLTEYYPMVPFEFIK